jgi:hypothetical protein
MFPNEWPVLILAQKPRWAKSWPMNVGRQVNDLLPKQTEPRWVEKYHRSSPIVFGTVASRKLADHLHFSPLCRSQLRNLASPA